MEWTKRRVFAAINVQDDIQSHFLELFRDWWTENVYQKPEGASEFHYIHEFFEDIGPNFERFSFTHSRDNTWIITYKDVEYVFPDTWPYDNVKDEPDLEMLWHSDYYDGPLSGIALYNGKVVWFDCDKWGGDDEELCSDYGSRTYHLYEISEENLVHQKNIHERFRKYVGHHSDYGVNYAPYEGKPREELDKFYEWFKAQPKKDMKSGKLLGTFSEVQFRRHRPLPFD